MSAMTWRLLTHPTMALSQRCTEFQQWRGICVKVLNYNLEQALTFMQRKMRSSGVEQMMKQEQVFHIKNTEKLVLARNNLERSNRTQDLARKLQSILSKKVRHIE